MEEGVCRAIGSMLYLILPEDYCPMLVPSSPCTAMHPTTGPWIRMEHPSGEPVLLQWELVVLASEMGVLLGWGKLEGEEE
eukprot:267694-Ditylum_brightwellii.AAC.1